MNELEFINYIIEQGNKIYSDKYNYYINKKNIIYNINKLIEISNKDDYNLDDLYDIIGIIALIDSLKVTELVNIDKNLLDKYKDCINHINKIVNITLSKYSTDFTIKFVKSNKLREENEYNNYTKEQLIEELKKYKNKENKK